MNSKELNNLVYRVYYSILWCSLLVVYHIHVQVRPVLLRQLEANMVKYQYIVDKQTSNVSFSFKSIYATHAVRRPCLRLLHECLLDRVVIVLWRQRSIIVLVRCSDACDVFGQLVDLILKPLGPHKRDDVKRKRNNYQAKETQRTNAAVAVIVWSGPWIAWDYCDVTMRPWAGVCIWHRHALLSESFI